MKQNIIVSRISNVLSQDKQVLTGSKWQLSNKTLLIILEIH